MEITDDDDYERLTNSREVVFSDDDEDDTVDDNTDDEEVEATNNIRQTTMIAANANNNNSNNVHDNNVHEKNANNNSAKNYHHKWFEMLKRFIAYTKEHHSSLVPFNYKKDQQLGRWVSNQRTLYKKDGINSRRLELLESNGFVWDATTNALAAITKNALAADSKNALARDSFMKVIERLPSDDRLSKTAIMKSLRLSKSTFYRTIKKYDITLNDFVVDKKRKRAEDTAGNQNDDDFTDAAVTEEIKPKAGSYSTKSRGPRGPYQKKRKTKQGGGCDAHKAFTKAAREEKRRKKAEEKRMEEKKKVR